MTLREVFQHDVTGVVFAQGVTEGISMVTNNAISQINTASARKTTSED